MKLKRKRKRKRKKGDKFVRLTVVPFLCEEEEEEVPSVSCVTEVSFDSRASSVGCKQVKKNKKEKKKKKKMVKRGGGRKMNESPQIEEPSLKDQPVSPKPSLKKTKTDSGAATTSKNRMEITSVVPRRSPRVQNALPSRNIEPIIENIEVSDGEEDHRSSHEDKKDTEATLGMGTIEEKIMNLMLLMEEQGKTFKAFLSEGSKRCFIAQNTCADDTEVQMEKSTYKNMYIDSQKKILELKEENAELKKKLETAVAKLEGYEKGQLVLSETINKFKDTCLLSTLAKTTEMVLGLSSSRAMFGGIGDPTANGEANTPVAKRKATTAKRKKAAEGVSSRPRN